MADEDSTGGSAPGTDARHSWGPRPPAADREPLSRRRKLVRGTALLLAGLLALGSVGLGLVYYKLNGNISGIDINAALGTARPEDVPNGSMDILVLGSDTRAGANSGYGADDGTARSDTTMIVHLHEGHERASVVSVPRDTLVERPSCETPDGGTAPAAEQVMFNESYQVGGAVCTVKTVESMTGIRMDHFLEVDFTGFKKLIDTLGGVEMTTKKPIKDPDSHLDLPAGTHTLNGEQALGLVRTRHAVGDGSDLGRIHLQQAFVRALTDQVNSIGLFSSPKKLYDLADTATSSVTTDSELDSVADLTGLAKTMRSVTSEDIRMVTMPVRYDPDNGNRVLPMEKKAEQVWRALRRDRPIPESATKGTAGEESGLDYVVR